MKLMKHQKEAVNEIFENHNNGNNTVIYTSGVGTGKTSVFCGVARNICGKILYIVPKKAIIANVLNNKMFKQEELKDRTDFTTFNYFSDKTKGKKLDEYSLIVIDEAHHIGSNLYGRILMKCLKQRNIKTLGLTATPERMDNLNVGTLFDCVVNGLTNFEAITQGLMPQIEYLVCTPEEEVSMDSVLINWEDSYKLLRQAVQENPKNKWICFFSKISELQAMKPYIKSIFNNYEILEVHSNSGNTQEILDKANKLDKCVMLNCDMLLEGLHFDNVDGIILFRNVYSVPVFEQIIGRVSAMLKKDNPLVIDCTDTWLRMDKYIEYETFDTDKKSNKRTRNGHSGFRDTVSIEPNTEINFKTPCYVSLKNKKYYDYMNFLKKKYDKTRGESVVYRGIEYQNKKACCETFNVSYSRVSYIENTRNVSFAEALDITLDRASKQGVVYKGEKFNSWRSVCKKYNIPYTSVATYKSKHNTTYEKALDTYIDGTYDGKRWTKEEREIFVKYYPKEGTMVADRLKNKDREQCRSFARRNNIKMQVRHKKKSNKKWTEEEIAILRKYYPLESKNVVKRFENRTIEQCRNKAKHIGVTCIKQK